MSEIYYTKTSPFASPCVFFIPPIVYHHNGSSLVRVLFANCNICGVYIQIGFLSKSNWYNPLNVRNFFFNFSPSASFLKPFNQRLLSHPFSLSIYDYSESKLFFSVYSPQCKFNQHSYLSCFNYAIFASF